MDVVWRSGGDHRPERMQTRGIAGAPDGVTDAKAERRRVIQAAWTVSHSWKPDWIDN